MEGMMFSLSPQSIFGSSPGLFKRQEGVRCDVGSSPCAIGPAVNASGCCANDNYCYVNPRGEAKCCEDGSNCDDPCPKSSYRCTVTSVTTCCPRLCRSTNSYQCAQSLGGGCCGRGSICLSGNSCSPTIDPRTVNTVSASPTGSGNTASATSTAGLPGPTQPSSSTESSGGLSQGAKAGISASVTLVGLLLLAFIVWFIGARRRKRKASGAVVVPPPAGPGMSQVSSPGAASSRVDYFGPDATQGPFTQAVDSADAPRMLNANRAVPLTPQGPGDITAPVEIGVSTVPPAERDMRYEDDRGPPRREFGHHRMDSIEGRVELP